MDEIEQFKKFCNIKKTLIDNYVIEALVSAMCSGELDLSGYPVGLSSMEALSQVLSKSTIIKKLKFCDCMLAPLAMQSVLNALMYNANVFEVNLYGNNISSDSTRKLGKMLSINNSIKTLVLNWNNIGQSPEAFSLFCDGLAKNESLEYLDLRNNLISSSDAIDLAAALRLNKSLKILDLRWNRMKQKGINCLQNAMQHNKSLNDLLVKGNFVDSEQTSNLELSLKQNVEVNSMKKEYDLKIELLLKELRKANDKRIHQMSKITKIFQQRSQEMENKICDMTQILINKEESLRTLELEKNKVLKQIIKEKERVMEISGELESLRKKNTEFQELLKEKDNQYMLSLKDKKNELKYEKEQNNELLKKINDNNIALETLKDEINEKKLKWDSCLKERTAQVEHDWKVKFKKVEEKFEEQIAELRGHLVEKEITFLKEEEHKLHNLRNRLAEAEINKSSLELEVSSLKDKIRCQDSEIVELQKKLSLFSSEISVIQQNLKDEQCSTKKTNQALIRAECNLTQANKTIELLEQELLEEKNKVKDGILKLEEVNSKMECIKKEEKFRSGLLASALKKYLSSTDSYFTE